MFQLLPPPPLPSLFQLGKLFEELGPGLEEIMAHEHLGVVTALLGACRKHGTHQQEMLQLLMEVRAAPVPPPPRNLLPTLGPA